MMYRSKLLVEAHQWHKNGDHPLDYAAGGPPGYWRNEGRVVGYYREPFVDGLSRHEVCGEIFHDHGWIQHSGGGCLVCPGDWIVTRPNGEFYSCKPEVFNRNYELAGSDEAARRLVASLSASLVRLLEVVQTHSPPAFWHSFRVPELESELEEAAALLASTLEQ